MKRILNYSNFLELLLERELPDNKLSDIYSGMTVAKKIVNFLKKYGYSYEPGKDSRIFVSFKTGDFDTIVPPSSKELGGQLYSSPQGLYCFDMNVFKKRLFADGEVEVKSFDSENLKSSSNEIENLGLGYANNGNKVSHDAIWDNWNSIPRWLYFVKVKDDSLILSSLTGVSFYSKPLMKFLDNYLHYFLKESDSKRFDSDNKKSVSNKKMSFKDYQSYFSQSSDKYKAGFIESLMNLLEAYDDDKQRFDEIFYRFIMECSALINSDKGYMVFTDICQAIGVDGFTQRKGQTHIHSMPKMQTVLLSDDCVEELMKIDLVKELPIDDYVSKRSGVTLKSFISGLKPGEVYFDEKNNRFLKFVDEKSFVDRFEQFKFVADKMVKVDLSKSELWKFITSLRDGDSIKIISKTERDGLSKNRRALFLPNINLSDKSEDLGESTLASETLSSGKFINYRINGREFNISFDYDISKPDSESPFFDPELVSNAKLVYWNRNKEELVKMGADWKEYSQRSKIFTSLDDLMKVDTTSNKFFSNDIDLLSLLHNFKNEYCERVFGKNRFDLQTDSMTLLLYRGDLSKPIKVINSPWTIWK